MQFKQWLEMAGTDAIYDPNAKGDFNWWGDPASAGKPYKDKKPKKKKKKKKKAKK